MVLEIAGKRVKRGKLQFFGNPEKRLIRIEELPLRHLHQDTVDITLDVSAAELSQKTVFELRLAQVKTLRQFVDASRRPEFQNRILETGFKIRGQHLFRCFRQTLKQTRQRMFHDDPVFKGVRAESALPVDQHPDFIQIKQTDRIAADLPFRTEGSTEFN